MLLINEVLNIMSKCWGVQKDNFQSVKSSVATKHPVVYGVDDLLQLWSWGLVG